MALFAVVASAGCWAFAAPAHAFIYWTGANTVGRANLDGTGVDRSFMTNVDSPFRIAADGQHLYWTSAAIGRASIDGSAVDQSFITGGEPQGLTVDSRHIYWTNFLTGPSIGRANLDGTGVDQNFIPLSSLQITEVAVDGAHIYWIDGSTHTIGRANLDGTDPNDNFITGGSIYTGLAVDGQHIYFVNDVTGDNSIARANLDGSGLDLSFIKGAPLEVAAIAVDGEHIYWTDREANTIGRANLDGTSVDEGFIKNVETPNGLAVTVPTAAASTNQLAFGSEALYTLGPPQAITVSDTGTAPLPISRVQVSGGDVDDFLITYDTCSGSLLAVGDSCAVHVRFGPSATGARAATLSVTSYDPRSPLQIPLSGTGVSNPLHGRQGRLEIVTCNGVSTTSVTRASLTHSRARLKETKCTAADLFGKVKPRSADLAQATISRAGVVYATGTSSKPARGGLRLVVTALRPLRRGHYTLNLRRGHGRHRIVEWVTITIG